MKFSHSGNSFNLHGYTEPSGTYRVEALLSAGWWHLKLIRVADWEQLAVRKFRPRQHCYRLPDATVTRLARELLRTVQS